MGLDSVELIGLLGADKNMFCSSAESELLALISSMLLMMTSLSFFPCVNLHDTAHLRAADIAYRFL